MCHQLVRLVEFVVAVVGEVLVAQDLGRREPQLDRRFVEVEKFDRFIENGKGQVRS